MAYYYLNFFVQYSDVILTWCDDSWICLIAALESLFNGHAITTNPANWRSHSHSSRFMSRICHKKNKVIVLRKTPKYVPAFYRYVTRSFFGETTVWRPTAVSGRDRKYLFFVDWHAITKRVPSCENQSCNWMNNYENTKFLSEIIYMLVIRGLRGRGHKRQFLVYTFDLKKIVARTLE